jgi:rhodanese-related sulfurtransferase
MEKPLMSEILQDELLRMMDQKNPPLIIDVRTGFEYRSAHIKNAVNIPVYSIFWNKKRLPKDKTELLILTCEHGPRAVMTKKFLWLMGYRNVRMLKGHMTEWKKNRLPTV